MAMRRPSAALENGAEALLTKPINFGSLRSKIDMRVERAAQQNCRLNFFNFVAVREAVAGPKRRFVAAK
jgi:DNA-binding response OmpR family regulator